jgi:hypothetical protein
MLSLLSLLVRCKRIRLEDVKNIGDKVRKDKGIPEQDAHGMQRQLQQGGMMLKIDCGSEKKRYRPLCVAKKYN